MHRPTTGNMHERFWMSALADFWMAIYPWRLFPLDALTLYAGVSFYKLYKLHVRLHVVQSVSGSIQILMSCHTLCSSAAKIVLNARWPNLLCKRDRLVYFIWFSLHCCIGHSGIKRGPKALLPPGTSGRRNIWTSVAILIPLHKGIVTGHARYPKNKVTASLVIEALWRLMQTLLWKMGVCWAPVRTYIHGVLLLMVCH